MGAVWLVLNGDEQVCAVYTTASAAQQFANEQNEEWPNLGPYTIDDWFLHGDSRTTERAAIAAAVRAMRNRPEIDAVNVSLRSLVTVIDELSTLADSIEAGHYAKGRDDGKSE